MKPDRLSIPLAAVAIWVAAAGAVGCAARGADAPKGAAASCASDDECGGDQICRAHLCSVSGSWETTLNFRFIPPNSSDFLAQRISNVQVDGAHELDFGLDRSININSGNSGHTNDQPGGIRYGDNPLKGPSGTLLFRPSGLDSQLLAREAHVEGGVFDARLTPGRYSLTFIPDDRTLLPKKSWPAESFHNNTYLLRTVGKPNEYVTVDGKLTREVAVGEAGETTTRDVAGAWVYALSSDGRHASTVVMTDSSGQFELKVAENSGPYDLFVTPSESTPAVLTKTVQDAFEVTDGQCMPRMGTPSESCSLPVGLGAYPAETVPVPVVLETPDTLTKPVDLGQTQVVVRATVAAGTYTRTYRAEHSEQLDRWQVTLDLYPVAWSIEELPRYTLDIIPPVDSPLARTRATIDAAPTAHTARIELEQKHWVDGHVVDADGNPVGSAQLELRPTGQPQSDSANGPARSVSTPTDDAGRFEVWLPTRAYEVLVDPPPANGQPHALRRLSVNAVTSGDDLTIRLPPPAVAVGTVLGASDADQSSFTHLSEVIVEAFQTVDGHATVVGQARTDANGRFRMALPADL